MSKADVDAVAKGRVWTGQEAYARHLVDKLGGIREALELARSLAGLPADAPVVEAPQIQRTLVQELLSEAGIDLSAKLSMDGLPIQVKDLARAVAPLVIYPDETPLMRLEWEPAPGR
jgi:protease-4